MECLRRERFVPKLIGYFDKGGTGIQKTGFDAHSDQRFILDNEHRLSGERQLT